MRKSYLTVVSLFIVILLILISQVYYKTLTPLTESGHRAYGAANLKAAIVIERVITDLGGLRRDIAFAAGPTRQIMFYDGTVINLVGDGVRKLKKLPLNPMEDLPQTGLSIINNKPGYAALQAVVWLQQDGFEAEIVPITMEGLPKGSFAFVRSNAFDNDRWLLVIRWWAPKLGSRPKSINFP